VPRALWAPVRNIRSQPGHCFRALRSPGFALSACKRLVLRARSFTAAFASHFSQPPIGSQRGRMEPGRTQPRTRTHPGPTPGGPAGTQENCIDGSDLYVFERSVAVGTLHTWGGGVSEAHRPVHEARGARVQAYDSPIPSMRCRAVEEQRRFRLCRPVR
jgi:hypothetical protein